MKVGKSVRYAGAAAAVAGLAALGMVALAGPSALAQTPPPLKIGVMDGFSGVYGDLTAGEVEAIRPVGKPSRVQRDRGSERQWRKA